MVGRALRGVLQGGTSEAYLVEFEDEQLNKILWEVPERDNLEDFLKSTVFYLVCKLQQAILLLKD